MKNIFDMDTRDFIKLKKFQMRSPKQFAYAAAGVLNSLAFTTRQYSIEEITARMIVRSPRFVSSSIRVHKAKGGQHINSQYAEIGSIHRPRFTGWKEQQLGKPTKEKKRFTIAGRGGSRSGRVRKKYKMFPGKKFLRPTTMGIQRAKSADHRAIIFLQMMGRRKAEPFYLGKGYKNLRPGLYEIKGGQLRTIARGGRQKQPRQIKWLSNSIRRLQTQNNIKQIWAANIRRIVQNWK